MLYVSLKHKRK